MNIHQPNFSNQETAQNINNIWAISVWINHIEQHQLKSYLTLQNGKKVVCFVWEDHLLKYAFSIVNKKIVQMNKFDLWILRAKWLWKKSNMNFLPRLIKESSSVSKFNYKIDDYIIAEQKWKSKIVKNPNFPDNTYIYKNNRWKEFKVITIWWTAINITCDNNYITWHQKAAIQRAINENRLNKFKDFSPITSTELKVINNTNTILEWDYLWKEPWIINIDESKYYENLRQKISDSSNLILSAEYIEQIYSHVEDFQENNLATIEQLEAAQSFITIMYKRTWIDKDSISDLLQTGATIHYIFNNIEESIRNEWYNINFIQVLLQLSDIIKNIFLSTIPKQKRAYH